MIVIVKIGEAREHTESWTCLVGRSLGFKVTHNDYIRVNVIHHPIPVQVQRGNDFPRDAKNDLGEVDEFSRYSPAI